MKRLLLAAPLLAGCSMGKDDATGAFDTAMEMDDVTPGTLRLDVYPPAGVGEPQLLPQSHRIEPDAYEDARLELYPTVTFSGVVSADVARSWAVGVPTTEETVAATISAWVDGTRLGGSAESDDSGAFSLALPAYDDAPYLLALVPNDAALAPFHVEERMFEASVDADVHLGVGIPVYGRVTDADGLGVAGVPMRLRATTDAGVEVRSAAFVTDTTGWYVGRVESVGSYVIEVEGGVLLDGDVTRVVPTVEVEVQVEDATNGASAYISLGTLTIASVEGAALDPDGDAINDALVRFTSTALDSGVGSLTIETTVGRDNFFTYLLPGLYDVTIVPPYGTDASPTTLPDVEIRGRTTLGNRTLSALSALNGEVRDATGAPLADVVVAAKQVGFDHYVYTAKTDAEGNFWMEAPDGEYEATFTPPPGTAGALTLAELVTGTGITVELDPGTPLSGHLDFEDAPVAWAWIDVVDEASGMLVGQGTTDASGDFRLQIQVPEPETDDTGR